MEQEPYNQPNVVEGEYNLVWHNAHELLDGQYLLEVRRSDNYGSTLHLFDCLQDDKPQICWQPFELIPESQRDSQIWNEIEAKKVAIQIIDEEFNI